MYPGYQWHFHLLFKGCIHAYFRQSTKFSLNNHHTEARHEKLNMIMDYAYTFPDAKIQYYASDMQLYINSDASYLVLPKARSRGVGRCNFSDKLKNMTSIPEPKLNGPFLTECVTFRNVMSSAAETECGTVFHNNKASIPVRTAAVEMGHPQGSLPMKTDNNTAEYFLNEKIKKKRSKVFDMKFHWMIDQID